MMSRHEKIDYLELPAQDLALNKEFFDKVFGWKFTDYGPEYTAFHNAGIEGGFYQAPLSSSAVKGAALIVFYSDHLIQTQQKIINSGGKITQEIFSFPGGKRFHFTDPNNNEYAVWTETSE